jgi:hypothetical protein
MYAFKVEQGETLMAIITFSVEVPDNLDSREACLRIPQAAQAWVDEQVARKKGAERTELILSDDEALTEWLDKRLPDRRDRGRGWLSHAVVRASVYDNQNINQCQVAAGFGWGWGSEPRRPVFMRGSLKAMRGDERTDKRIVYELVARYLRAIKFTCSDPRTAKERLREIVGRIRQKNRFYLWQHDPLDYLPGGDGDAFWMNGIYYHYSGDTLRIQAWYGDHYDYQTSPYTAKEFRDLRKRAKEIEKLQPRPKRQKTGEERRTRLAELRR